MKVVIVICILLAVTEGKLYSRRVRNAPVVQPASNIETGQLVVNIYSKPASPVVTNVAPSSSMSSALQAVRDRIKVIQSNMPSMPSMPTLPPFKLPSMPTLPKIPERVKVPVRVQVETESVTFPPPRPLPTLPPFPQLPPIKVPNKVIVGQMEVVRPSLPTMPTFPTMRPIEIVYEDVKAPQGPFFKPGSLVPSLPTLPPSKFTATQVV